MRSRRDSLTLAVIFISLLAVNNKRTQIKGMYSVTERNSKREILPTKTDTRHHLKQFYFGKTGATHRHLHKTPKKNRSGDFPARVVPLGDRSLESLRRGALSSCRAYLAPCARQLGRGFWGSSFGLRPLSRCGRGGEWQTLRFDDTLRKTLRLEDPHQATLERSSQRHPVSTIRPRTLVKDTRAILRKTPRRTHAFSS